MPEFQTITESVYASGTVKSLGQYQAFPTVTGVVKTIIVKEGEDVKKGQPIITIENESARIAVQNSRLSAEYANVDSNADKLHDLKINIDLARNKMENDSLLFERQKTLWTQNIGSQIELEQRKLAFQNSSANLSSTILKYNDLRRQINFESRKSEKNLQLSSRMANDYIVKSEIDGKVYSIPVEIGELVSPQRPVAVIGDAQNFILELQVDEYDISRISLGQKVLITMDSYKGHAFEARLSKIDPIMNERSKSFTVEAVFINRPDRLYPNLTAEANIVIQTKENVLTIPSNYLLNDTAVILENGDSRKVSVGLKDYRKAEITNGLSKEESIIRPGK